MLALMIEQRLSKTQILELYLNRIYLGGSRLRRRGDVAERVRQARRRSRRWRNRAFIAGLIRMPSALWPWSHYDRALQRSHVVLARMRAEGFITPQAEQQARATPPRILADPGLDARRGRLRAGLSSAAVPRRVRGRQPSGLEGAHDVRAGAAAGSGARRHRRGSRSSARPDCRRRWSRSIRKPATCSRSSADATSGAPRSIARSTRSGSRDRHSSRSCSRPRSNSGMSPISPISDLNDLRVPGLRRMGSDECQRRDTRHVDAPRSAVSNRTIRRR